jgi:hypothetical protein
LIFQKDSNFVSNFQNLVWFILFILDLKPLV